MKRAFTAFGLLVAAALVGLAYAAPSVSDHDATPITQHVQPAAAAHDLAPAVVASAWTQRAQHAAIAADLTCENMTVQIADRQYERCTRHGLSADALIETEKARRFRLPDKGSIAI